MRINTDGNVGIGTTSNAARLYVNLPATNTATTTGIFNDIGGDPSAVTYGVNTQNNTTTNSAKYGLQSTVSDDGTGERYGLHSSVYLNTSSTANSQGIYSLNNSQGNGSHHGIYNYLLLNGTSSGNNNFGAYNEIQVATTSNNATTYGTYNYMDYNSGNRYGHYNELPTDATATASLVIGSYNDITGSGNDVIYGLYNNIAITGTGPKLGTYNLFGDGQGSIVGIYNIVPNGTNPGTVTGTYNAFQTDMGNAAYGTRNEFIQMTGVGAKYGTYAAMSLNSGSEYGSYVFIIPPVSTDAKTGYYSSISNSGTGDHVGYYADVPGGTNAYAAVYNAGHAIMNEGGGDYDVRMEGDTDPFMFFGDAGTNYVGIGQSVPTHKLDVYDASTTNPTLIYRGRNGAANGTVTQIGSVEYFQDQASSLDLAGGSNLSIGLGAGAAYNFQLAANSAAKPGSNAWTIASDERLKRDITPFKDGLETLRLIDPVYFQYNGKANIQDEHYYVGVVAQDLQEAAPYMVGSFESTPGDIPFEQQEANKETYLSVDNGAMTYITINAIKQLDEQQEKVKETFKNISDFGTSSISTSELYIPFSDDFSSKLDGIPVVTVTPLNSSVSLSIVSQTDKGFTVRLHGDGKVQFNWIAMARVQESVLEVDSDYTEAERQTMLNKVKAENAEIDFEREYREMEAMRQLNQQRIELEKAQEQNAVKPAEPAPAEEIELSTPK